MHDDLGNSDLARRLHELADAGGEAPYDWVEFQRRRDAQAAAAKRSARYRLAVAASALLLTTAALGYYFQAARSGGAFARGSNPQALVRSSRCRPDAAAGARRESGCAEAAAPQGRSEPTSTTRSAMQRWFADLPRAPVVHRVGTQLAETGLVDQIATLDQLLSAERVAHARPQRVAALERQRAQLVGSLAQFRYAELLAQASR